MSAFSGLYGGFSQYWLLMAFLVFTAFGGSFIKPSVLGTVAVTSTPETKSLGFAIYYWLVNAGAMIGPTIAYFVRDSFGNQFVYIVSSISCFAMLIVNILLYKEVKSPASEVIESFGKKIENLFVVLANFRVYDFSFNLFFILDNLLAGIYNCALLYHRLYQRFCSLRNNSIVVWCRRNYSFTNSAKQVN